MRFVQFTIGRLAMVVVVAAVCFAALKQPNEWWVAGMTTLVLAALGFAILGVSYRLGRKRAFWLGFLLFGAGYGIVSAGPWFVENVRPSLITTSLIDLSFPRLHPQGAAQSQQIQLTSGGTWAGTAPTTTGSTVPVTTTFLANAVQLTGSAVAVPGGSTSAPMTFTIATVLSNGPSEEYRKIGHASLTLIAGMIGGLLAQLLLLTRDRGSNPRSTPATAVPPSSDAHTALRSEVEANRPIKDPLDSGVESVPG
jgi:hypothetical protein